MFGFLFPFFFCPNSALGFISPGKTRTLLTLCRVPCNSFIVNVSRSAYTSFLISRTFYLFRGWCDCSLLYDRMLSKSTQRMSLMISEEPKHTFYIELANWFLQIRHMEQRTPAQRKTRRRALFGLNVLLFTKYHMMLIPRLFVVCSEINLSILFLLRWRRSEVHWTQCAMTHMHLHTKSHTRTHANTQTHFLCCIHADALILSHTNTSQQLLTTCWHTHYAFLLECKRAEMNLLQHPHAPTHTHTHTYLCIILPSTMIHLLCLIWHFDSLTFDPTDKHTHTRTHTSIFNI